MRKHTGAALAALALVLLGTGALAGCGGSDNGSSGGGSTATSSQTTKTTNATASGGAVTIKMGDYFFRPNNLTASAGKLKVTGPNGGSVEHELVLIKSDQAAGSFKVQSNDEVSEKGAVGEIADVEPGKTKSTNFNLKAGKYVMICNLPGHYANGMYGSLIVK